MVKKNPDGARIAHASNEQKKIRSIQQKRLKNTELNKAIYGLLAYFEDHQIKERPLEKNQASFYNFSEAGQGSKSKIKLNLALFGKHYDFAIPMFLKVRNMKGEWPSFIHFFPEKFGAQGRTLISVQDSNLFSSAFCLYALYYFQENTGFQENTECQKNTECQENTKAVLLQDMRNLAHNNIDAFKRNAAYNFWPQQEAHYGNTTRVAPLNFWATIANSAARFYSHKLLKMPRRYFEKQASLPNSSWVERCLNDNENPNAADALFNIANDADDTSVALNLQFIRKHFDARADELDVQVLTEFGKYRDINRKHQTRMSAEDWRKNNSGAFLTWLRDEKLETFEQGELGLIPGGINNIDIVVNANVVFTLALTGNTQLPGFQESCDLLVQAIEQKRWPEAGLYYPQEMIFPYAVSRALREGHVQHAALLKSRTLLLKDVLAAALVDKHSSSEKPRYYFSGGADALCDLSTALALNTLLNLGEELARSSNCLKQYRQVLEGGIAFLLTKVKYQKAHFKKTEQLFSAPAKEKFVATWEDGLFFSSSYWDLSHWRSQSISNAAVLEVFAKYLLAYDLNAEQSLIRPSSQLQISSYQYEHMKNQQWLFIEEKT